MGGLNRGGGIIRIYKVFVLSRINGPLEKTNIASYVTFGILPNAHLLKGKMQLGWYSVVFCLAKCNLRHSWL